MHSVVAFDGICNAKCPITDGYVLRYKSDLLRCDLMSHTFWKSGEDSAAPETFDGGFASYPGARMEPEISICLKQLGERPCGLFSVVW